jgi:sulfur-oxidizing protein SoxY
MCSPAFAEDPMNVPVSVRVDALADVQRLIVLVDRNPIRKVLEYQPLAALPAIAFRFKLEQDGSWAQTLGQGQAKVFG